MLTPIERVFGFDYGKQEWYFTAREGIKGPYATREDAAWAMITFIKRCVEKGLTGGRNRNRNRPVLTQVERIFGFDYGRQEWYFTAREGIKGPYATREDAAWALIKFIKRCIEKGLTGGKNRNSAFMLEEIVIEAPHWMRA